MLTIATTIHEDTDGGDAQFCCKRCRVLLLSMLIFVTTIHKDTNGGDGDDVLFLLLAVLTCCIRHDIELQPVSHFAGTGVNFCYDL